MKMVIPLIFAEVWSNIFCKSLENEHNIPLKKSDVTEVASLSLFDANISHHYLKILNSINSFYFLMFTSFCTLEILSVILIFVVLEVV